jgi:hypothetical protein
MLPQRHYRAKRRPLPLSVFHRRRGNTLNLRIRYRESFRPFAPAVLRENVADWFELEEDSSCTRKTRFAASWARKSNFCRRDCILRKERQDRLKLNYKVAFEPD